MSRSPFSAVTPKQYLQYYGTIASHRATPGDLAMFAEDLVSIITTFVTDLLDWVSDFIAFILTGIVETID